MAQIDTSSLTLEVRAKLAELDLELSEGDITQKGYDKKRTKLLEPYLQPVRVIPAQSPKKDVRQQKPTKYDKSKQKKSKGGVASTKQFHRDDRYRSDLHSEAVQQALVKHGKSKRVPVVPLGLKRSSLVAHSLHPDSDEISDDEMTDASGGGSLNNSLKKTIDDSSSDRSSTSITPSPITRPKIDPSSVQLRSTKDLKVQNKKTVYPVGVSSDDDASSGTSGKNGVSDAESGRTQQTKDSRRPTPLTEKIADFMPQILPGSRPNSQRIPPDVTHISAIESSPSTGSRHKNIKPSDFGMRSVTTGRASTASSEDEDAQAVTKVSAKIQQLLNTLKESEEPPSPRKQPGSNVKDIAMKLQRPKKKPLAEYFQDDQDELEELPIVENAPKPGGPVSKPHKAEQQTEQSNFPHSLEAAIHRFGTANPKASCLTTISPNGKSSTTLTYGKLLSRMRKVAYMLIHKRGIQPGSRVALVFSNSDPITFVSALYGCMLAGIVPVAVEDSGCSQLGFLLGSCGVDVALTCDNCMKSLPKNEKGEIIELRGWPKLRWIPTDSKHLPKAPPNWEPTARSPDNQLAYIEYKTGKMNSVVGISHPRTVILNHCRSIVNTLCYNPGDVMVNLLDFKRGIGLVHGLLTSLFTGMHVFCIPYALMKQDPTQWLSIVTKNKVSLALVKSRDLHWTLAMHRDNAHVDLKTLRMLLVSDAANPWSLGSSDVFLREFEKRGLRRDAVCPCAWSQEALTVAVRRPGTEPIATTISLHSLSYGVVQTQLDDQATTLMIQDVGTIFPGATIAVIKLDDASGFCKTDEVGEIILSTVKSGSARSCYYGLGGISEKIFNMQPVSGKHAYIRTGLLGYVGPSGRVFVTGKTDSLLKISGRMHNADDVVATVLAVEPMRFVYRGRIAVFSIEVLKDERLVIIVEQKPDATEDECFKWMSSVIQAVDGIHGVGIYCLSLLPPNGMPKTPLGGIHLSETIQRFIEGELKPCNILMCPHQCVTNLPKPRQKHKDIGPASLLQGQVVTGVRLAEASGRALPPISDGELDSDLPVSKKKCKHPSGGKGSAMDSKLRSQFIGEILKWRAVTTPDHPLFSQVNAKAVNAMQATCSQMHRKAEKIAQLLLSCPTSAGLPASTLSTGDHVALMFNPGLDLIAGFYGCLYAGCIPVPIRPIHAHSVSATTVTVKMIVNVSKAVAILTNNNIARILKSKEVSSALGPQDGDWPPIIDIEEHPRKKHPITYRPPTSEMLAYIDFSVSTSGILMGVKMSHISLSQLCRSMKMQCELYPSRSVALCLDPYSGLSFVLWCLNSIYSGHHSFLIPPSEVETNPLLWLQVVSQNKIRDAYLTYSIMELCTKDLAPKIPALKGASCPDPSTVFVDTRSLRNDRVSLVEKGSPHSLCLMEIGKILSGAKIVIADCDTRGQCADSRLGEIWVSSPHNSNGYYAVFGGDSETNYSDHFEAHLNTGDTKSTFCRTGFLGFLRRTELTSSTGERHDALYVVGSLEETLEIRGMRYHPMDIENSVVRCSSKIMDCAVFISNNLLVVAVELDGSENCALDLVPLVTNIVLREQYLITGVVVILDPGSIPVNSRGEKQRMHLRDTFLQDRLDPIYVAYNM